MKVGINARYLIEKRTGIENYLYQLIINLSEIDEDNEYMLFLRKDKPLPHEIKRKNLLCHISRIPTPGQLSRVIWEQTYLPLALKRERIDVFHGPSFIAPLFKTCPQVVTIHDLSFFYSPESFLPKNRLYFKALLPLVVKQAELIIADSESSKSDLIEYFKLPPDKVRVIYFGVDSSFKPIDKKEAAERLENKYGIKGDFILHLSLLTPRKNLPTLFNAYKNLRKRGKLHHKLVIVGKRGWMSAGIFETLTRLGLDDEVIFTGYVPEEDLAPFYNAASLFVYPSLYEGFGLPPLEAMACGTPVISSNISSLPEVVGEAGIMVNPHDVEGLSEAMEKVLGDETLQDDMRKKGIERAKLFSWEETAKKTLLVYKEALARKG